MDNSTQIKNYLQAKGKTHSWLEIAEMFGVQGTRKQKSDYVRRLSHKVTMPNWADEARGLVWDDTRADYSDLPLRSNYAFGLQPPVRNISAVDVIDFEEFIKWKESKKVTKHVTSNNGIHIVLGCVHVPFQNTALLNNIIKFIEDNQDRIGGFHLIGDYLDLRSLSKHNENTIDLSGFTLGKEYAAGNTILNMIESVLPENIQKTYIYGNHEDRYFRHVSDIRNYKTADAIQSPEEALNLVARGYQVLNNWKEDYVQVGKYQLIHGVFCTQNSSKAHIDKLRNSVMFAHTHRIGQHYEGKLHGVNIGNLANMNSDAFSYMSRLERQTWKNGFGIINVDGDNSQAEVVVCDNNGFFFGGKKY